MRPAITLRMTAWSRCSRGSRNARPGSANMQVNRLVSRTHHDANRDLAARREPLEQAVDAGAECPTGVRGDCVKQPASRKRASGRRVTIRQPGRAAASSAMSPGSSVSTSAASDGAQTATTCASAIRSLPSPPDAIWPPPACQAVRPWPPPGCAGPRGFAREPPRHGVSAPFPGRPPLVLPPRSRPCFRARLHAAAGRAYRCRGRVPRMSNAAASSTMKGLTPR